MAIKRSRFSFAVSFLLHALVVIVLFSFLDQDHLIPKKRTLFIEVEKTLAKILKTGEGSGGVHKSRSFRLKDLGVKYGWQHPTGPIQEASPETPSHGVDLVKEGKESPLFKYVHEQVDDQLAYPAELKARAIQGSVSGALVFSKGEFSEDQTRLVSDSSFLKVAVMRALRRAFRENLPEKYWKLAANSEGRLEVECRFVFAFVEHDDEEKSRSLQAVSGHALAFYRTYVHSALQWKLGPLSGLGPLVSLDVLWLPEKIGELFSKKAEIDPLDSYRDDPAW
jgi:hypothetical protein